MANPIIKIKNGNVFNLYANETDAYSSSGGEYLKPLENGELAYNAWNNGLYIGYNGTNYLLSVANANNTNVGSQTFNGTATNAIVAQKLGGSTVGGSTRPIYLSSGSPKGITSLAIAYGGTGATNAATARNNLGITTITDDLQSQINTKGIHYIVGNTSGDAGAWTGDCDDITAYYDGLVIAYKIGIAGANTTTLNINDLGAKTVKLNNTTALTTHYPVGAILILTYSASDEYFKVSNYDSNNKVNIYREDGSGTDVYPLLFHYTKTDSLTQADGKSTSTYAKFNKNLTVDPKTGTLKGVIFDGTNFIGGDFSASGNYTAADTKGLVGEGALNITSTTDTNLDRGSSNSLVIKKGAVENARFDASGHFMPGVTNTYNIGSSSNKWKNIYASTFYGSLSGTASVADKIGTTTVGSSTKPIYINAGTPVECGDSLGVDISGNAATASAWKNGRTFTISGAAGGTAPTVKGDGNVTLVLPTSISGLESVSATTFNGSLNGTASVATLLGTTDIGDSNTPIWIDNGTPKAVTSLDLNTTGNAATATKWANPVNFSISGTAGTSGTSIDGDEGTASLILPKTLSGFTSLSADAFTGGVWNGTTISIAYGGTGLTASPSMLVNLGSTTAANVFQASPRPGVTGTLSVANGGTGATTFTSGAALIGNGTGAIGTRAITNNTSATAVSASTNLITANTLYYHKGNSNLTIVGTIGSGTWNGSTIAVAYGGTGNTSQTANRLIYSETAAKLSSSGHYASSSKVAINSTDEPTDTLYVNGASKIIGNLTIDTGIISITKTGNPYIHLNDGTNNWYYQAVQNENKVGLGPTWAKATTWDVDGNVAMPADLSVTGTGTISGGLIVTGRPYGSGDDQGIVVTPASNGYAGISLGSNSAARTTLYLFPTSKTHRSAWRYNDGTSTWDITHPEVSGEIVVHTADTAQGSSTQPVYVADTGVVTASDATVGSGIIPMYISNGSLTASASTVGTTTKPIYMNGGTLTASNATVGTTTKPIYMSSGTITASNATVGSGVIPMYMSSGTLTASTSTVGSGIKPIFMSSGTITASSSTVGTAAIPVYMSSGTITKCTPASVFSAFSSTAGTTAGETLSITVATQNRTLVLDHATASQSGVVTTGTQTFAGAKTLYGNFIVTNSDSTSTTSRSVKATTANGSVGIYQSTNRGLYDFTKDGWIIYSDTTNSNAPTIPSRLYVPYLTITSTASGEHIKFSREGFNYITYPSGGNVAINCGSTLGEAYSQLIVNESSVRSGTGASLGTSADRWVGVYGRSFHAKNSSDSTSNASFTVENYDGSASVSLMYGSGQSNVGIYDHLAGAWIMYRSLGASTALEQKTTKMPGGIAFTGAHGTGTPGTSTAGYGVTGAVYFKRV